MIKGIIGRKVGMTQIFEENGTAEGVTVVQAGPCLVTEVRTPERNGYTAVQLGYEELRGRNERKLNEPEKGHLRKKKLPLLRYLREVEADDAASRQHRRPRRREHVRRRRTGRRDRHLEGQRLCRGGQAPPLCRAAPRPTAERPPSRAAGSIGSGTTPGRVYKGLRMAGHMGNERVTVQNLRVLQRGYRAQPAGFARRGARRQPTA